METREVPVLSSADRPTVDRLAAGLSDDAARVLAYLVLRADETAFPDAATIAEIRLGTGQGRKPARDALSTLEDRALVERTTVESASPGRPPTAWSASGSISTVATRVHDEHAGRLLERASSIAGIDGDGRGRSSAADGSPAAGEDVVVGLNWEPNALHLSLYAAAATESYADRGLCVSFRSNVGSQRAVEAVAEGEATVGVAGAATVARARAADVPVAPIAALFQRSMVVVYSAADAGGRSLDAPADLRGARVGMPTGTETALLGRLFLSQSGLLDAVELVDVDGEEHDALARGDVDVVTGIFSDPLRLERAGIDVDVIRVAERYPIPGPVLVAREDRIADPRLGDFLAGTVAGWAVANRSPAIAAQVVADEGGLDPDDVQDTFERAVTQFCTTETVTERGWGWLSPDDWHRLEEALAQLDLLRP